MNFALKRNISFLLSIFLVFSLMSLVSCRSNGSSQDRPDEGSGNDFHAARSNDVVFSINGNEVTKAEIEEQAQRMKPPDFEREVAQMPPQEAENFRNHFIIQAYKTAQANLLFQIYAEENGITVTEEDVQYTVEKFKNMIQRGRDNFDEEFEDVLKQFNLTYDDFLSDMRKQALQDKVMEPEFNKIEVTEDELLEFYERNYERYNKEESAHLHIISVESKAEAEQVLDEIVHGGDFHEVARRFTPPDDLDAVPAAPGDIGPIPRAGIPPSLHEEVFNRERPLLTPFVASIDNNGQEIYFVMRVKDFFDEENFALEEVMDIVMDDLMEEKRFHKTEEFLQQLEEMYTINEIVPPPARPDMQQMMPPMP